MTNRLNRWFMSNVATSQRSSPNPQRFELARRRRGMTKTALAQRSGVSTVSLSKFAHGRVVPAPETISAIAEVLRFPASFFYRQDLEEPSPDAASFRSLSTMTASQRDAALAAGALAFELSEWIDSQFELPSPDLPDLQDFDPEGAAEALRSHWRIGNRPIGNMIGLMESHGVRVFSLAEQGKELDAFSLWHGKQPFVFLNTIKTSEHSRMDAAHELGHLVLHVHGAPRGRDVEREAKVFGSAFLMPRGSVLAGVPRLNAPTIRHLIELKKNWKVSASALAHRMHALGLISDWSNRGLCIELSRYGRTREPEGIPRETSHVLAAVFGALKESGTTKANVAHELDLYAADVDALIFGLSSITAAPSGGRRRRDTVDSLEKRSQFRIV